MDLKALQQQLDEKRAEGKRVLEQIAALQSADDLSDDQLTELSELEIKAADLEDEVSRLSKEYSDAATQAAEKSEPMDAVAVVERCNKAKASHLAAKALKEGWSEDRLTTELTTIDRIRGQCTAAGWPDDAERYIASGLSADQVRFVLNERKMTLEQHTQIDNTLNATHQRATIDPSAIYQKRREMSASH